MCVAFQESDETGDKCAILRFGHIIAKWTIFYLYLDKTHLHTYFNEICFINNYFRGKISNLIDFY